MSKLALYGGKPLLDYWPKELFHWPIVNDAMREAQLKSWNPAICQAPISHGSLKKNSLNGTE